MANRGKLIETKSIIKQLRKEFDVNGLLSKIIFNHSSSNSFHMKQEVKRLIFS